MLSSICIAMLYDIRRRAFLSESSEYGRQPRTEYRQAVVGEQVGDDKGRYGSKVRNNIFRLTDFYTLFYYKFIESNNTKVQA